jgi:hypothetical protein
MKWRLLIRIPSPPLVRTCQKKKKKVSFILPKIKCLQLHVILDPLNGNIERIDSLLLLKQRMCFICFLVDHGNGEIH